MPKPNTPKALPVDRFAEKIKESVQECAVTLITGQTGCGKSSRVPQMLQQELGGAVICTQPRRLAVVAIASHVAELVGCQLGQDVGFRIGQRSIASKRTSIMFATSGFLLEDLRANGAAALRQYKALIIDELHERSVESDLLLACLHALLASGELPTLKLVLMSATANVERYQAYFKRPGEHVALIRLDLQLLKTAIGEWLESVKVVYLDNVVNKLLVGHQNHYQHKTLLTKHQAGSVTPAMQVRQPMASLIHDLILYLDALESDPAAVILVFLPTYRALVLQHDLLQASSGVKAKQGFLGSGTSQGAAGCLEVFALHSSVDIDDALEEMQSQRVRGSRLVVLATNIAESSITVPNVKHVVDSCTFNELHWDPEACRDFATVEWTCQSAAQQRAGRTGRTCPGTCYRLITRAAYNALPKYEASVLTRRSLRREVLCLLSASSKQMRDPRHLLSQALEAPSPELVDAALDYLQQIGAACVNSKGKVEPTQAGALLAALPISLESSLLLVQGGLQGRPREAAVLAALMNTSPMPIMQPFGSGATMYLKQYLGSSDIDRNSSKSSGLGSQGSSQDSAVDCLVELDKPPPKQSLLDIGTLSSALHYLGFENSTPAAVASSSRSKVPSAVLGVVSADDGTNSSIQSSALALGSNQDDSAAGTGRTEVLLANLAAYYAWQQQWCDAQNLQALKSDGLGQQQYHHRFSDAESEWCRQHHLLPSSLKTLTDLLGTLYAVLHMFRPSSMLHAVGPPAYFSNTSAHTCDIKCASILQGGCSCKGLDTHTLLHPPVVRQLQVLLQELDNAGTADADRIFLQHRLDRLQSSSVSNTTSISNGLTGQQQPDAEDTSRAVCKYFLAGSCRNGSQCPFEHSQPTCKFYLSRSGCRYGSSCRFAHTSTPTRSSTPDTTAVKPTQTLQPAEADLWFDWLAPPSSSPAKGAQSSKHKGSAATACGGGQPLDKRREGYKIELLQPRKKISSSSCGIVLLGEGDLSFASALASARRAAGLPCSHLTVTVLEQDLQQLVQFYPRSKLPKRLLDLQIAGAQMHYGVDATQLPSSAPGIDWASVGHLVWNFPFASSAEVTEQSFPASKLVAEDEEACKTLMRSFFAKAARLVLCHNDSMKVHVALCNDQYGRWGMDTIARQNFLFLEASKPLDLSSWPGYSPKRGQLATAFPAERPVVYTFVLHLPETCSALAVKSACLGRYSGKHR